MAIYDTDEDLNARERAARTPETDHAPSQSPGAQAEVDQLNAAFNQPARADSDRNTQKPAGDNLYNPDDKEPDNGKRKVKKKSHRNAKIAGVLISGLLGVGGFNLFASLSGPFHLINDAKRLLQQNGDSEQAGNITLGRALRYLKTGNVGETRVGAIGSRIANNTTTRLKGIGLDPIYGKANVYDGFTIDTANKNSPYYKMDEAKVRKTLAAQGVTDGITVNEGKISVSADAFSSNKASVKAFVASLGVGKFSTAARVRYFSRFGFVVSNWHPFQKLKNAATTAIRNAELAAWEKAREKFLSTGQGGTEVDASHAQTKDEKGNVSDTPGTNTTPPEGDISTKLKSIAGTRSFKIAGGIATAVGLACAVRAIGQNVHVIVYAQMLVPASRMAWDTVTMGQQIMYGKDVDLNEMGVAASQLYDDVSKTSFESGKPFDPSGNGPDMPDDNKSLMSGALPSWLAWSQSGTMGDLCGTVGSAITTTVSVVVGVLSGGVISTAAGFVASSLAGPGIISSIAKLAAGNSVNVLAKGGERGIDAMYGARLNANTIAVQNGGTIASTAAVSKLNAQQERENAADFHSKSLAYRLFNPTDDRTLISHVIDSSGTSPSQNLAILASGFAHMGSVLLRMPATLLSGIAHADSPTYTYPFPTYLPPDPDSPAAITVTQDPDTAARVLDSNPQYIDKAKKCFNVTIAKDGAGLWDVVPGASGDVNAYDFYDKNTYNPGDCASDGDNNWNMVKAFVQLTNTMEGYDCVVSGDNQSCTNDGFTNVDAQGNPVAASDMQAQAQTFALNYQQLSNGQTPLRPALAAGANQTVAQIGRLLGAIF